MENPVSEKQSSNAAELGCAFLFGLPFLGFGLAMGGLALRELSAKGGLQQPKGWIILLFHVVFTAAGLAVPWMTWRGRKFAGKRQETLDANRETPWLTRPEWASGRIENNVKTGARVAVFVALIWNAISWPIAYAAITQEVIGRGKNEALLVLIFPIAGAGMIWWAVYSVLQARRFGKSSLVLEEIPVVIGTVMRAVVVTGASRQDIGDAVFSVKLTCYKRRVTGSGKNRHVSMTPLWQDDRQFRPVPRLDRPELVAVPIAFPIPADASQTTLEHPDNRILWQLKLTADIPGIDYAADFEIPVFRTPDSPAPDAPILDIGPSNDAFAAAIEARPEMTAPISRGISMQRLAGGSGLDLRLAPMRNIGPVLGLSTFLTIWGGAIWFMIAKHVPIFLPIVFGLFFLLIFTALVTLALVSSRITVENRVITVTRGPFGLGAARTIFAADVKRITISTGFRSGDTAYWNLEIIPKDGKKFTIADAIRDKYEAEWLASEIARCAEFPPDALATTRKAARNAAAQTDADSL